MSNARIIKLSEDCQAPIVVLLYDHDSQGVPGVIVRAYLNNCPRDRWISIPDMEEALSFIDRAKARDMEKIVAELVDEMLDLRLAVQMVETVVDGECDLHDKLDSIRIEYACDTYESSSCCGPDESDRKSGRYHFENGYRCAMADYGISGD